MSLRSRSTIIRFSPRNFGSSVSLGAAARSRSGVGVPRRGALDRPRLHRPVRPRRWRSAPASCSAGWLPRWLNEAAYGAGLARRSRRYAVTGRRSDSPPGAVGQVGLVGVAARAAAAAPRRRPRRSRRGPASTRPHRGPARGPAAAGGVAATSAATSSRQAPIADPATPSRLRVVEDDHPLARSQQASGTSRLVVGRAGRSGAAAYPKPADPAADVRRVAVVGPIAPSLRQHREEVVADDRARPAAMRRTTVCAARASVRLRLVRSRASRRTRGGPTRPARRRRRARTPARVPSACATTKSSGSTQGTASPSALSWRRPGSRRPARAPCSVRTDSGWNCTPCNGRSRCAHAHTTRPVGSSHQAVTSRASGTATAASEW